MAGSDDRVAGLVYIAAAAPLARVPFGAAMRDEPGLCAFAPQADRNGLLWLSDEDFVHGLAHDLPEREARLLWAVQKPLPANAFGDHADVEGWREKRCWYLVADDDRVIPAATQRGIARQIAADTRTTAGGHMVALSQPAAVADLVRDAAHSCSRNLG